MSSQRCRVTAAGAVFAMLVADVALGHEGQVHKASVPAAQVLTVTLEGELVDPQCWYTHNGEGAEHAGCATMCARGGQDVAFLDQKTGTLYAILAPGHGKNPNDGMYAHIGKRVRVKGTAYVRADNRGLLVQSVEPFAGGLFEGVESSGSSAAAAPRGPRT